MSKILDWFLGLFSNWSDLFRQVDLSSPSWDLFILLLFIMGVFLYGITMNRDRLLIVLVSMYISMAVIYNVPYLTRRGLGIGENFSLKVVFFIFLFIFLLYILSRMPLLYSLGGGGGGGVVQIIIFSMLHVGLFVSIILSFLPTNILDAFAPITRAIFTSDLGKFFWTILPILTMALMKKK
jgi:hypothetical protein